MHGGNGPFQNSLRLTGHEKLALGKFLNLHNVVNIKKRNIDIS